MSGDISAPVGKSGSCKCKDGEGMAACGIGTSGKGLSEKGRKIQYESRAESRWDRSGGSELWCGKHGRGTGREPEKGKDPETPENRKAGMVRCPAYEISGGHEWPQDRKETGNQGIPGRTVEAPGKGVAAGQVFQRVWKRGQLTVPSGL